jgi:hypothetical protein
LYTPGCTQRSTIFDPAGEWQDNSKKREALVVPAAARVELVAIMVS